MRAIGKRGFLGLARRLGYAGGSRHGALFRLLGPEVIGVQLTEGFMMEPEASVSALVFHHPDATYFSVGAAEMAEATAD